MGSSASARREGAKNASQVVHAIIENKALQYKSIIIKCPH
jgi:hypothetical protein